MPFKPLISLLLAMKQSLKAEHQYTIVLFFPMQLPILLQDSQEEMKKKVVKEKIDSCFGLSMKKGRNLVLSIYSM